ncbi:glycosyltransferase involved in cell wall biosynthesis [Algoriphagus boseongensis]|uniref:Glycosyltransferase involved in cell wall biosynthesis n=1 Tax=Algoriphagus boseongensis TaxID=1442587 RepID=A0A4R6TC20_9BACT|nr:glycosyltransferase family 4 protein [Algoriphagus boseongensis]TDQ19612.1 glycosyltransferase involved in cell wall biosynthesis [Algoriphagus boseongensis]
MKILYFYQYYSTPKGSWGTRVHEFAREWVKQGHQVQVVSSIYSKSDLKAEKFIEHQNFEGVDVTVINVRIDNKQPFLKRIFTFIAYAVCSIWYALTAKADLVIASSGPITVGIPGLVARYLRRKKLVFEARDLWPEGAIELGLIKNPLLKKIAYALESRCYKASSLVVALSEGMRKDIQRRFSKVKVIDVTNAANIPLFSTPAPFDGKGQIEPKKYLIYTGNIGEVNNSLWILEAAKILKSAGNTEYKILMVGEGQQREFIEQQILKLNLDNLMIWGLMPKHKLVGLIQNAVVSLVPLKGTPVLDTSSPNKFFESLSAGVPVVQTTQGWMKDYLKKHRVGFTLNPDDPNSLVDFILSLKEREKDLTEMGDRAKTLAAKEFSTEFLAQKMLNGLLEAAR